MMKILDLTCRFGAEGGFVSRIVSDDFERSLVPPEVETSLHTAEEADMSKVCAVADLLPTLLTALKAETECNAPNRIVWFS